MSISAKDVPNLIEGGGDVCSSSGDKIGGIRQVYLDNATGEPAWVTAKTGLVGTTESFIPLDGASRNGDDVIVTFDEDRIRDAPQVEADGSITPEEEAELYRYYGLARQETDDPRRGSNEGRDDDATLIRSEEELRVGTEKKQVGKARLRKYVVTENVTITVPIEREIARLEREPVGPGDDGAGNGPDIDDEGVEIILSEEVPVVHKERVAKEKVHLVKDTVTEEVEVSEEVQKEQIDTDIDERPGRDAH